MRPLSLLAVLCLSTCLSLDANEVEDDAPATGIAHRESNDFDEAPDEGVESRDFSRDRQKVVTLPLTADNVFAIIVILLLACVGTRQSHDPCSGGAVTPDHVAGCVYLFKLLTRKSCTCPLCRNQYELGSFKTQFRTATQRPLILTRGRRCARDGLLW